MSKWYNDPEIGGGSFLSAPVGTTVSFTVSKVERDHYAKYPLKRKDGTSVGWAIKITTNKNQEFMLNTWALLKLFRENKVDIGDTVEVRHPIEKVWELSVLSRDSSASEEEIDMEDLGKTPF